MAFSPDGTRLASGGDDGTVRLWDVPTRRPIGHPLRQHDAGAVNGVAFSPDGATLASGANEGPNSTGNGSSATLQFWDVATGRARGAALKTGTAEVDALRISPDGKRLATGSDNTLQLWDPTTRRKLGPPLASHTDSSKGRRVQSGREDAREQRRQQHGAALGRARPTSARRAARGPRQLRQQRGVQPRWHHAGQRQR